MRLETERWTDGRAVRKTGHKQGLLVLRALINTPHDAPHKNNGEVRNFNHIISKDIFRNLENSNVSS